MTQKDSSTIRLKMASIILLLTLTGISMKAQEPPFTVWKYLYDQGDQNDLGLSLAEGTETYTIFAPNDTTDQFSNGAFMTVFKDWLYCQWQSSQTDEDAQDTWIAYSRSQDGIHWSEPMVLAETIENGYCSSGGWWVWGDTLVAYINTWPSSISPRGGFTQYITSADGMNWSEVKPLPMADRDTLTGIFEQDPHALPDGRIVNAAHFQRGLLICPIYTDDPSGIRGWKRGNYSNLSISGDLSREIEPSWFQREDDALVMIFRDQNSTFKKLAAVSTDRGENWTQAVLTDMPDARTKQSAGNLPDGTAYMAGNPVNNKTRLPLAVTLSADGHYFNTAYLLRYSDSIQAQRYSGKAKRAGYHYPKSMVWKDTLYVSYATNKEDVDYTRVPLKSLVLRDPTSDRSAQFSETGDELSILVDENRSVKILMPYEYSEGMAGIYNLNGQILSRQAISSREFILDMQGRPAGIYILEVRTNRGRISRLFSIR